MMKLLYDGPKMYVKILSKFFMIYVIFFNITQERIKTEGKIDRQAGKPTD